MIEQKYLVWGGLGVGAVILLLLSRGGGSSGGTRLTTLGPLPSGGDSDAAYAARTSAFSTLANVTASLGLEERRGATAVELARFQAASETTRLEAALKAAELQAKTAMFATSAAKDAKQSESFWDAIGGIGEAIVNAIGGGGGQRYGGQRYGYDMGGFGPPGY